MPTLIGQILKILNILPRKAGETYRLNNRIFGFYSTTQDFKVNQIWWPPVRHQSILIKVKLAILSFFHHSDYKLKGLGRNGSRHSWRVFCLFLSHFITQLKLSRIYALIHTHLDQKAWMGSMFQAPEKQLVHKQNHKDIAYRKPPNPSLQNILSEQYKPQLPVAESITKTKRITS